MEVADKSTLRCSHCGYSATGDKYGFLHHGGIGKPFRYVSDWSKHIFQTLKAKIRENPEMALSAPTKIHMIDPKKDAFREVGQGTLHLDREQFHYTGTIGGEATELHISISALPTLPFTPGRHLEIQDGNTIYRCVLEDGRLAMKFINMVKIFFELKNEKNP
jgi:hypothetical protein